MPTGMNGDNRDGVPLSFVNAAAERAGSPTLPSSQNCRMNDEARPPGTYMSWGYYTFDLHRRSIATNGSSRAIW